MNRFKTQQEEFWAGSFGDEYVERSQGADHIASRTAMWARILRRCHSLESVTELGANVGLNLRAIRRLLPKAQLTGVEINAKAAEILRGEGSIEVLEASFLEQVPSVPADLAIVCTVLIHINPERLPEAYEQLAGSSKRYVVISEYYNPSPTEIAYRGHSERLFKRDFAGEFLDAHPEFVLEDYGFIYHRDPLFPVDDFNWFLLARR